MKPILATEARLQYSSLPAELPHSPHFTEIYHLLKKEQQVLNKLLKFFDICFIEMYIIKNIAKVVSLAYNGHILTPLSPSTRPTWLAGCLLWMCTPPSSPTLRSRSRSPGRGWSSTWGSLLLKKCSDHYKTEKGELYGGKNLKNKRVNKM